MTETKSYTHVTLLDTLTCGECEIPFAIPSSLHKKFRATGQRFWCPNGHHISYSETENQRLKARAEREERWRKDAETRARAARDQAQAAERRVTAYKGHATRLRKRAAAGVCPCCTRTFQNVARHMASQHPGYAASDPDG